MACIVTHTSPDWDAICSCWLLQRYGPAAGAVVRFVNTGAPDAETLSGAWAVVDTGREFDPDRLRFDHHQDAYPDSATARVAQHLNTPVWLTPLIVLVHHGDWGSPGQGADWSRRVGLHAALSGAKARGLSDDELLAYGYTLLDDVAAHLKAQHDAWASLGASTVWKSDDGLVWAIQDGGPGATRAAGELGARLVVYGYTKQANPDDKSARTQYGLGVWRCGGAEVTAPHCGEVATLAAEQAGGAIRCEIDGWFKHPVGFCALAGSDKAPRYDPPAVGVVEVAQAISAAWRRPA